MLFKKLYWFNKSQLAIAFCLLNGVTGCEKQSATRGPVGRRLGQIDILLNNIIIIPRRLSNHCSVRSFVQNCARAQLCVQAFLLANKMINFLPDHILVTLAIFSLAGMEWQPL